jgi:hypothetical protein
MKISNRRIALLTGASVSVLGIAAPAHAATVTAPGVCSSAPVGPNASDTLDITLVTTTGVSSNSNPAIAIVSGCPTGEIIQGGQATGVAPNGDVDLTINNGAAGTPVVMALAHATDAVGDATAAASIFNYGMGQVGGGAGTVDLAINNDGLFLVDVQALATAAGHAVATATFGGSNFLDWGYGIYQSATGGAHGGASAISAAINNSTDASITIDATAIAHGATGTANAHADWGIWQIGSNGETIAVDLTNDGAIGVNSDAVAVGTAGAAHASADLLGGILQAAYNGGTLTASLENGGEIGVHVNAVANASTTGVANAHLTYGIGQTVGATSLGAAGSALASITNAATIGINVHAQAVGGTLASANATIGGAASAGGIVQLVNASAGTSGAAVISNGGAIDVAAIASASATGVAVAHASVAAGALQSANGSGGDASATFTNDGTFSVTASAHAADEEHE